MEKHYALNDEQFEQKFELLEFNAEQFTHEAHLRLAWIHLNKYNLEKARENITKQIYNFIVKLGAEEKFSLTLTIASINIINHFYKKEKQNSFKSFIESNPRLKTQFKQLLSAHYSDKLLNSDLSKYEYLEPDLLSFT